MSKIAVLNEKLEESKSIDLPKEYASINPHNLYLYVKSYQASLRANTASAKDRSQVSGSGKKPWRQKGTGSARVGSKRNPVWTGGGVVFGPSTNRNYYQKVNKKQKRLALEYALFRKAEQDKLFAIDSLTIDSGKTKDAANFVKNLGVRDLLVVKDELDAQTLLAYRNLANCYVIDKNEINAYLVAIYSAVIIEKSALNQIIKEG
ncbi:50S ribosomal protein L4 [uncultured Campylobacter sp.]|uniref:50S ribosomal protein L4 n=1 Tax=uncultured Campylobacter sp. TaxID=218934 RepID=UPI00261E697D|nr:50S ribosomal protein L4 [uncultured Campylobacter sp.]